MVKKKKTIIKRKILTCTSVPILHSGGVQSVPSAMRWDRSTASATFNTTETSWFLPTGDGETQKTQTNCRKCFTNVAELLQICRKTPAFCVVPVLSVKCGPGLTFYVFTLDAGLLARSQYSEGPATGHLDTDFSWFPFAYKRMLRWFPRFQVATTCFSCSPPDLSLLVTSFMFCIHAK